MRGESTLVLYKSTACVYSAFKCPAPYVAMHVKVKCFVFPPMQVEYPSMQGSHISMCCVMLWVHMFTRSACLSFLVAGLRCTL